MWKNIPDIMNILLSLILISLASCASPDTYYDPNMDFAAVKTVAVMPFANLTNDKQAGERVRDVFTNILLSTGEIYALPPGEVARGFLRAGIADPTAPSAEEIVKLAGITRVDAVFTGVLREYGEIRSGTASGNIISLSLQMIEAQTGKVVWTASSTKGGIRMRDRLFGTGGKPMNDVTEEAVNDILKKLFQ